MDSLAHLAPMCLIEWIDILQRYAFMPLSEPAVRAIHIENLVGLFNIHTSTLVFQFPLHS